MTRGLWPVLIVVLLLAACAGARKPESQPVGTADFEVLPPPPYEPAPEGLRPSQRYPRTPAQVERQPPPSYPESALADEVACTAKLLYHILKDGTAKLVRLEWDEPPPAQHQAEFEDAIRAAMLDWRFIPMKQWVPTKREDGSIDLVPQTIPKAERASVRFRVEGGRGIVE